MNSQLQIRTIQQSDNVQLAAIVRNTLTEFGCNKPGTAFADPETDFLFEQFKDERTTYFVAVLNDEIVGGAGIGFLKGYNDICELQKMYLKPHARGQGFAAQLMQRCIAFAAAKNFKQIYLETMTELSIAVQFYKNNGFVFLDKPLSQTGHFSCNIQMIKTN
jgi:putative acetyltransferase